MIQGLLRYLYTILHLTGVRMKVGFNFKNM